jgi:hypothetical protein
MRHSLIAATVALSYAAVAHAYIEVPHSLGQVVHESTNIVVMEVSKINTEKNLIIYKKLGDLKGKHQATEIKHNIGKRGFHEREWKTIMQWAQVGKKALFFYNGQGSETCIGGYWYQAYNEGEWWGLSHAEPFLLRTFYGEADTLAEAVTKMLKGEEVVITCFADGNKNDLHQRKGKLQRMRASLKKLNYDAKRDFVGWGGDGAVVEEFKTIELLAASSSGWLYLPASAVAKDKDAWITPQFNDAQWRKGKAPIGYGEEELNTRKGTIISEKGQPFVFRRAVEIPEDLMRQPGAQFRLAIASDDSATVFLNGNQIDHDTEDHEFAYWNREIDVPVKALKPGRNVLAIFVRNGAISSDLYLDAELTVQIPLPRKPKPPSSSTTTAKNEPVKPVVPMDEPRDPNAMQVDKAKRTVTIACAVAQRKLPNLEQVYPIEVGATWPAPRGRKAHETIVTFKGLKPSEVHKALVEIGLTPGKPAYGENTKAEGPELQVFLEWTADGKTARVPIEQCLVHRGTTKTMIPLTWKFTGSVMKQPDPEKDDKFYGADITGTLLSLFPVTDETVLQTTLTMKDEPNYKLELNTAVLPKEGTPLKLVLVAK